MNSLQVKKYAKPSFVVSIFIIIGAMYGFGTFGLLNLFGARVLFQFVYTTILLGIVLLMTNHRVPKKEAILALVFFVLMGLGGLVNARYFTAPLESIIILCVLLIIAALSDQDVLRLARVVIGVTFLFCSMVLVAYVFYIIFPEEYSSANIHIYSSTVGAARISPSHLMDWVSFTSGDGYVAFGEVWPRMKGFSNEPSSTVVHYLAPAVLAFLLGGRYFYMGIFILTVNIIAIASLVAHIIFIISIVLLIIFLIDSRRAKVFYYFGMSVILALLLSPTLMTNIFIFVADMAGAQFDLIHRKIGGGDGVSSLSVRQSGMVEGILLLITSPIGYSADALGAGSGLLYNVSSRAGWIGVVIILFFVAQNLKHAFVWLRAGSASLCQRYGLALMMVIIFVALFISGYGWERPVGFVVLALFFRVTIILFSYRNSEAYGHNARL